MRGRNTSQHLRNTRLQEREQAVIVGVPKASSRTFAPLELGNPVKSLYEECARRCRERLLTTRSVTTIEQLRLWLDELGQQSDAAPVAEAGKAPAASPAVVTELPGLIGERH